MKEISVRELQENDIPLIDAYWQGLSEEDLARMYVDRSRLPSSLDFRLRLSKLIETPLPERASDPLIWEVDGKPVGFTNLNNIQRGKEADIHLHIFNPALRAKGLGRRLFSKSVEEYLKRHNLKKIVCQPASKNPGPNGLMRALGISATRTYRTTPSAICIEHDVCRYEIDADVVKSFHSIADRSL